MKTEIWKPVVNYENSYEVSSLGRIKSLSRKVKVKGNYFRILKEKILKQHKGKYYYSICLNKENVSNNKHVHQIVAESFLKHIPNGMNLVINHKDLNKLNNCIENLEIVTNRENLNKKHIKSTSNFTGVSWHKLSGKWQSYINENCKRKHLGLFESEIEASKAYNNELIKIKNYENTI